jgi:hypothetical protein
MRGDISSPQLFQPHNILDPDDAIVLFRFVNMLMILASLDDALVNLTIPL